jgi:hypothetical protein
MNSVLSLITFNIVLSLNFKLPIYLITIFYLKSLKLNFNEKTEINKIAQK